MCRRHGGGFATDSVDISRRHERNGRLGVYRHPGAGTARSKRRDDDGGPVTISRRAGARATAADGFVPDRESSRGRS